MEDFVCGGAAAITASVITHPLDLVRVRLTLAGEQQRGVMFASMRQAALNVYVKEGGVRGFYRGMSAAVARQAVFSSVRFGVFMNVQRFFNEKGSATKTLVSTTAAGASAALLSCPADVALVRMQADGRLPEQKRRGYGHVGVAVRRIAQEEGLKALYRGCGPLVARGVVVTSGQFATYDACKRAQMGTLSSGLAAGFVAACLATPADVVKARMMTSNGATGAQLSVAEYPRIVYTSSADCVRQTLATEGVAGFFKGFVPCYARMGPQVLIMWSAFEQYKKILAKIK